MSDNRDTLMKIGKLIAADDAEAARDAVHIAVIPMVSGYALTLLAGDHVDAKGLPSARNPIGIVDPFLRRAVNTGERFWCFLFPGSITSLRHVWTHPDFPEVLLPPSTLWGRGPVAEPTNQYGTNDEARHWLKWYAESLDLTYRQLMEGAEEWLTHDKYLVGGSNLEGERVSEEFWHNYEIVTGTHILSDKRENFFSCSC